MRPLVPALGSVRNCWPLPPSFQAVRGRTGSSMRWFYHPSIRKNLTRIIMLTTTAALLLAGAVFGVFDLLSFQSRMKRDLMTLAEILQSNSTAPLTFNDPKAAEEILASLTARPHVLAACIYDRNGTV